jgi:NAD-dependent SIR2 family protein deacetylase
MIVLGNCRGWHGQQLARVQCEVCHSIFEVDALLVAQRSRWPDCVVCQERDERDRTARNVLAVSYPPFSPVISPICYDKGEML